MYYFTTDEVRLEYSGEIHSSPFEALQHAPGPMLHKVGSGEIDATEVLREFTRWCALQVIDEWDAPDVVREYLETGDEWLREEAKALAKAAAWKGIKAARAAELTTRPAGWKREDWDDMWARAEVATVRVTAREAAEALAEGPTLAGMVVDLKQREKFKELVEGAFEA